MTLRSAIFQSASLYLFKETIITLQLFIKIILNQMQLSTDDKINFSNIGLMFVTAICAYFFPFETFLLAYAYLGPLHYLTEISWLHDRNYFAKGKFDFFILLTIGVLLSAAAFSKDFGWNEEVFNYFSRMNLFDKLLVFALFSSLLFAFVKNIFVKIVSILLIFVFVSGWLSPENASSQSDNTAIFALTSLVPTLIHVYLFTGFFMLFGALKSRSKSGLYQIMGFVIIPIILIFIMPVNLKKTNITNYGRNAHYADGNGFFATNVSIIDHFNLIQDPVFTNRDFINLMREQKFENLNSKYQFISVSNYKLLVDSLNKRLNEAYIIRKQPVNSTCPVDNLLLLIDKDGVLSEFRERPIPSKQISGFSIEKYGSFVYSSTIGIMLMRFIAFAYLYHYLNWFSKTEIIRWHKIPKIRLVIILAIWILASVFYAYDYSLGLSLLFFLSFTHVLLEFPLNMVSIIGIGKETWSIMKNGFLIKKS